MSGESERIGPYTLGEILGEGGMAIVYRAEQSQPVKRTVAIKVLKPGMDSNQIVARFESERQTLALLEHPHIAKVYDAGATSLGRPYFVMEWVRGVSITHYCDQHHLDIRSRVRLFIDVCAAVQHAHQKGMIHRDLKPSNILVEHIDDKPIVKVIDFGVAKAIGMEDSDRTQLTRMGQLVGTPLYMSPEQAQLSGPDVDTRSDIYSLGVVLYEMLAGAVPLELNNIADYALGVALSERDPPPPSQRAAKLQSAAGETSQTAGRPRSKVLRGDLDWIAMKAIAKDRTRRYQTANELAIDLDHYLRELPVLARAPSAGYLLNRFVRRNRVAVAAASLAAVAIIAGAVAATLGFVQARAAERKALAETETERQISSFLVDLFNVSDPSEARGNTVTAREILDKASARVTNELTGAPAVRATLMSTMAEVYEKLGLYSVAAKLAIPAMELRDTQPADAEKFADSLDQVGEIYSLLDRGQDAEPLHDRALALRLKARPDDIAAIAKTMQKIGVARYVRRDFKSALDVLVKARVELDRTVHPDARQLGELIKYTANLYHESGDLRQAIPRYREALQIFRDALGGDHALVAATLGDLAIALKDTQQYPEAEKAYLETLALDRKLFGARHPDVANTLNNVAVMYMDLRRFDEALVHAQESTDILRALLGDDHEKTNLSRLNAARAHVGLKHYQTAEDEFRKVLAIRRRTLPANSVPIGTTLDALADVLNRETKFTDSETCARESVHILEQALGGNHFRVAIANRALAASLVGQARYPEAEPILLGSYALMSKTLGESHLQTLATLQRLVEFYSAWGKPERADEMRKLLEKTRPTVPATAAT